MIIESVPYPDLPNLLQILVNGEEWRKVHTFVFGKKLSLPNVENLMVFEEEFNRIELNKAKQYAVKCLARKPYLSEELKKKLSEMLVSEGTISKVIADFTRQGYLNDRDWIQHFISRQSARGYGPKAIVQKLRQRGVSPSQISSLQEESSQTEQILQILRARFKARDLSILKERQRVINFFIRRGFSFSLILDTLKTYNSQD